MPLPFNTDTWVRRPDVPSLDEFFAQTIDEVYLSPDGEKMIASKIGVRDWIPENKRFRVGYQWTSEDQGGSWIKVFDSAGFVGGPLANGDGGGVQNHFSIDSPAGRYYFRFKVTDITSFFVGNGSLWPGGIMLEYSDDGIFYYPQQEFVTWPHFPVPGVVGTIHAGVFMSATPPVNIPRSVSVPGGTLDADWMILAYHVESDGVTVTEDIGIWYSTDYGFTWVRAYDFPFGSPSSTIEFFTRNPATGRLHVSITPTVYYSDDNGATWTASPTPVFLTKVCPTYHPGGTMNMFQVAGLTALGANIISCDNGVTWGNPLSGLSIPLSTRGAGCKLSAQEILFAARDGDFSIGIYWSDSGGEVFTHVGAIESPDLANQIFFLGLLPSGNPILFTEFGRVFYSSDRAKGTFTERSFCPLASAGLAAARRLPLCGKPLTFQCNG